MNRVKATINNEITPTQAAYRTQKSTTEDVFACKLIIDNIKREMLIKNLQHSIEADELHIIYYISRNVEITQVMHSRLILGHQSEIVGKQIIL